MASSRALNLTVAKNICSVNEMCWEADHWMELFASNYCHTASVTCFIWY